MEINACMLLLYNTIKILLSKKYFYKAQNLVLFTCLLDVISASITHLS